MHAIRRSDALLASHPLHAFYWPLFAAYVYSYISGALIVLAAPELVALFDADGTGANREKWIYACVLQGLILLRMSLWAEKTTGQPFGAPVRADMKWFAFAVFAVPIIHSVSFDLMGGLFSVGEGDWTIRDDFDNSMFEMNQYSLMLLYVILIAPIVEEVGFRGILLGFFRGRGMPKIIAVLITAAGFAALHTQYTLPAIAAVFILGLVLGWLRLASNSIGPPIIAHIAVNAMVVL
ncbi:MAG: type II CAAX endopeptidase family protein [Hyphomonadaceae bacterium]